MTIEVILLLFSIALLAGFIDTLAGGGGLLTLPALLLTGMSPVQAIATNKLQAVIGTATATTMMFRKRKVTFSHVWPLMLMAFIGSAFGALLVLSINSDWLEPAVPFILVVIGVYFLISPKAKDRQEINGKQDTHGYRLYQFVVVPIVGMYDGFFGPGTGAFFTASGTSVAKMPFLQATAIAKTLNFSTNFSALILFVIAGKMIWMAGFVMMFGQFLGAWLGSHMLFTLPVKLIRLLAASMCFLMVIKLVWF
ncbi:MAG: TSUP family transporter [Saccharospirillaceae bacterium]|nr:TSUP family transporter [Pseudomonadales bacterium]NRB79882.1 TSUP family transporter [Saccharospirillaceae bacterium]